jgi:hypothetical protein
MKKTKKNYWCLHSTHQRVGDAHTIQAMRRTPLGIQKCPSTLSLKRLGVLYLLVQRISPVVVQFVADELFFFPPLKIITLSSWLLVFQLQSLFF